MLCLYDFVNGYLDVSQDFTVDCYDGSNPRCIVDGRDDWLDKHEDEFPYFSYPVNNVFSYIDSDGSDKIKIII